MTRSGRTTAAFLSALAVAGVVAGCGSDDASGSEPLTVYSAQHENLVRTMLRDFTEATGVALEFRDGNDAELANQIVQEGDASPADVFLTENSPAMDILDREGLLTQLEPATLAQVGEQFRPSSGNWTGFAARSTVLVHNPTVVPVEQLPASILDLANPEWRGRVGIAAGGPDFQAIVAAVLAMRGEDATRAWLQGLERNADIYQSNTAVMTAADEGEIDVGVMYHYYWYRDRAENGLQSDDVVLHYFRNQDPGAFVSVSGAGVLASSDQAEQAQLLVDYLTSPAAQERLAESTALEYAVGSGVASAEVLPPLDTLQAPPVDPGSLDQQRVTELMQEVGLL
ncbi:MAG TPA: iron ABC transporter substrate-binding protein [Geodermatophilus sp.]|nr:iron ABC transporter substrate-binding protein [Geodermatophilus sp.]